MHSRLTLLPSCLLSLLLISPALGDPAAEPTTTCPSPQTTEDSLPRDFIAQYLKAIEQSPRYHQKTLFPYDTVRKAADQWQKEIGLQIVVQSTEIGRLVARTITLPDGRTVENGRFEPRDPLVWISISDNQERRRYSIPTDQLAPLKILTTTSVVVLDPVNEPGKDLTLGDLPLADALSKLAMSGRLQIVYRSDQFSQIRVTCDLRGKTIGDSLDFLGRATGFQMIYDPQVSRDKPLMRPQDVHILVNNQGLVPILPSRISSGREPIRYENLSSDPLEDLHQRVVRSAELLLAQRPVLVVQPADAAPASTPTP